jgi:hypothetical protein
MKQYKNRKSYYSDFWLDKSMFEPTRVSHYGESAHKSDLIKLASYKRAIGNFVNIVTGKSIPVKFSTGDQSYTDGDTVVISSKLDDAEFDPIVGLALHEGSHIKLTDFSLLKKYFGNSAVTPTKIQNKIDSNPDIKWDILSTMSRYLKDILNIVEDRRIDSYVYNSAPGYRGYYHSMYDKYFNDSIIDKGLKSNEYTTEDWESYMFRLINITNKNRRIDALKAFSTIWNLLDLNNIGRLKTTEDSMDLASEIFLTIYDAVANEKQDGNDGSSNDNSQNNNSGDGSSNGQSPMSGDFDTPQTGNESMNSSAGGGEGDEGKNNDEGENNDSDIDSGDGNLDTPNDSDKSTSGGTDKLSPNNKNKLDKAINKQKDFLRGNISKKKMSKTDSNTVNALEESNVDLKNVSVTNDDGGVMRTDCYVVKKLTKQLIESRAFEITTTYSWWVNAGQRSVDKGISLGVLLGKKLKTRDENRSLITPRLKSGKISSRMLHEIGFGNFNIFDKIQSNSVKPVTLHISIDASGSMGGDKWDKTQTAVVAIAKAASMTSNINVVISYRSTYSTSQQDKPLIVIAYDSRVDNFSKIKTLFCHLTPAGTTPEGLCYEAIMNEILNTKDNSEKYLINFSDGMPQFADNKIRYTGDVAVKHTASQINKMKMNGVSVLSYYVSSGGGDYNMNVFSEMYGKDARFVNVTEVIELAKTLNAKFEVGVQ